MSDVLKAALLAGATATELRVLVAVMEAPQGLTAREIAEAIGSTMKSVNVMTHRMRRKGIPIEGPRADPAGPRKDETRGSTERYTVTDTPTPPRPDFEPAWRELHDALSWIQFHKGLPGYLGWNFADVANDLIRRAYPDLGVPSGRLTTRKPARGAADDLADALDAVLEHCGARGTYDAIKCFDAYQAAGAQLRKFKGARS